MGRIVPYNITVLVNRYLTVCANDWSDEFNYLVYNDYRPQTKFVKVMFSQVFVCPHRGLCPRVGSLSRGVSMQGSLFRRVSVQRVSVQGGVSVQGVSVQGDLCAGALCSGGSPVQGVFCQGDHSLYGK